MKFLLASFVFSIFIFVPAKADEANDLCEIVSDSHNDFSNELNHDLNAKKYLLKKCTDKSSKNIRYFKLSKVSQIGSNLCQFEQETLSLKINQNGTLFAIADQINIEKSEFFSSKKNGLCPKHVSSSYFNVSGVSDTELVKIVDFWNGSIETESSFNKILSSYDSDGLSDNEVKYEQKNLLALRENLEIRSIGKLDKKNGFWQNLLNKNNLYYVIFLRSKDGQTYVLEILMTSNDIRILQISRSVI